MYTRNTGGDKQYVVLAVLSNLVETDTVYNYDLRTLEIDATVTLYWAFFEDVSEMIYLARGKSMGTIEDSEWLADWDDSSSIHSD